MPALVARTKEIMYTGETKHPDTLTAFKMAGVLQWVAFLFLASAM